MKPNFTYPHSKMYIVMPRLHRSHLLSYWKSSSVSSMKASTISGAMNSADPTGVNSIGVVSLPPPLKTGKNAPSDEHKGNRTGQPPQWSSTVVKYLHRYKVAKHIYIHIKRLSLCVKVIVKVFRCAHDEHSSSIEFQTRS